MKKSEKKKIAVGVCGTVFRSFLIFTVISCLLSMVLYQIFVVSAWLTFVFVMFASVTRTEKKKKKKNRFRWSGDPVSAVGGETSQLSHAQTLKKNKKIF